ncbi:DNA polymerase III, delta prime subunit [Terribacillus aidingensis]|uniref:DNA polymerase III, delta prime subunit n=1 Tax=Terribacillus aidingensis TaxID=586416 RepID=A0A285P986_9BACI|nr:DNA polymerase III subunit delta' [Terribacillus aidingensis]SNZ18292.1 DNA polymerase III, delta prime subunit [Terribacillus aidingensis]
MSNWTEMSAVQPVVSKMLINSLKRDRISHAYIFQGARGTGKAELSRLYAKSIFCKNRTGAEPCNDCKDCRRIDSGNHPDLHWIIPDGASIKNEQILKLQKEFSYTGMESERKVYVMENADKMTANASNRLLKFLEEPGAYTTAILLTENSQALLQTIQSRCQILALQPLQEGQFAELLNSEGISQSSARLLSQLTNNYEEAMEISGQEWFAKARKLVVQLVEVLETRPNEALLFVHSQWMPVMKDREMQQLALHLLLLWFKDIIYLYADRPDSVIYIQEKDRLENSLRHWTRQRATDCLQSIMEAKRQLDQNVHPALVMEKLTLQMQR